MRLALHNAYCLNPDKRKSSAIKRLKTSSATPGGGSSGWRGSWRRDGDVGTPDKGVVLTATVLSYHEDRLELLADTTMRENIGGDGPESASPVTKK